VKKWFFIVGIAGSGVMFLISGTLIGYAIREQNDISQSSQREKSSRKPDLSSIKQMPPFLSQLQKPIMPPTESRLPSGDAILMANNYNKTKQ
jgi:hypothetical protein